MSGIKGTAHLLLTGSPAQYSNGSTIGIVENSKAQALDLKKRIAALIIEKLREFRPFLRLDS